MRRRKTHADAGPRVHAPRPRILGPAALILIGLVAVAAEPGAGQDGPAVLCFRPAPAERCRSFVLFEARGQSPFVQPYRTISYVQGDSVVRDLGDKELSHSFGWDAGLAFNLDERWAAGLTLGVEWGERSVRYALTGRLRRWLHDQVALEVAAGPFRLDPDDRDTPDMLGGNAALRVALWDAIILALRYDGVSVPGTVRTLGDGRTLAVDPGGWEGQWSVGVGLESWTGLIASGAGFAVLFIGIGALLAG